MFILRCVARVAHLSLYMCVLSVVFYNANITWYVLH